MVLVRRVGPYWCWCETSNGNEIWSKRTRARTSNYILYWLNANTWFLRLNLKVIPCELPCAIQSFYCFHNEFSFSFMFNQSNLEVRPIVRPKLESMQAALHFAHACSCWHAHACLCLTLLQLRVLNRIITSIIIKQYSSIKVLVLSGRANDLVNWNSRRTSIPPAVQDNEKMFFFEIAENIKRFFHCSISRSRNGWWWEYATSYRFGAATNSLSCYIRDRGLGIRQNNVVVIWIKNGVLWRKNLGHVPSYTEL